MFMILDTVKFVDENLLKVFFKFQIIQVILQFKQKTNMKVQSSLIEWGLLGQGISSKCCKQNICVTHHFEMCFTGLQIDIIQSGSLQEFPRCRGSQTKHVLQQF